MITYCDVNTCEDCPRYGDDCDGDKKVEHTDYISRADAIEAVRLETSKLGRGLLGKGDILDIIEALPSADAEPKRVLQGYNKGANTIQTIRHEELTQIANIRKAVESADAEQGFRGGKIPPKEMLDGTVLIPQHQWLEMERELAELKDRFESADAVQGEWIDVKNEPYCECSVCGSYIDNLDDDYAFCPRCGARMKGGTK